MQPFSSTAIAVLLTVIIGFAIILIVEMVRQKPRRPQPRRSMPQPAENRVETIPQAKAITPQPEAEALQMTTAAPQTEAVTPDIAAPTPHTEAATPSTVAPTPHTETATVRTAQAGSLLEARPRPSTLIKPVSPLVSLGRSVLIAAGFVAMAFLILIALPQSWFEGILKRLPGKHYYVSMTSGESLWLVDLSEEKSAEQLRVTGKVRNVSSRELRNPQVVIKVFGFDNTVMGTVAAPLREYYLAVQAESDFAVAYQVDASRVLRYTVIFQEPDGTALVHKDTRSKP
jgi:hypothetical protein